MTYVTHITIHGHPTGGTLTLEVDGTPTEPIPADMLGVTTLYKALTTHPKLRDTSGIRVDQHRMGPDTRFTITYHADTYRRMTARNRLTAEDGVTVVISRGVDRPVLTGR